MPDRYSTYEVVHEHGIVLRSGDEPVQLRPLASTHLPVYAHTTIAILDEAGHSLTERAVHLAQLKGGGRVADYYEEMDLRYCTLAMLYHLNRLIDLYVDLCRTFEALHPPGTAVRGNIDEPRVFYETDAFLAAARRVYESFRRVLWKHYRRNDKSQRWRSFTALLPDPHDIPASLLESLCHSWTTFGTPLRDYRDCLAHYDPLTDGHTTCWMQWFEKRWGVVVKLPGNPKPQSRQSFDFSSGPEALDYCHRVACHIVTLGESICFSPALAAYLKTGPTRNSA